MNLQKLSWPALWSLLVLPLAACVSAPEPGEPRSLDRRPLDCTVVAHRGWSAQAPENTLAAIAAAVGAGAGGCEFDVYRSRDGVVVLMHDKTVDRTTDGTGKVTDLPLARLKTLDAGSWKGARFTGEKIPTLEEALNLLKGTGCTAVVEIKMEGISRKVIDAIRAAGMVEEAAIIAFNPTVVKEVRTLEPDLPCGWLSGKKLTGTTEERADWITDQARKCGTRLVDLSHKMLCPGLIAELHRRGFTVWTWTVNGKVPSSVGVPERYPEAAVNDNPAGRAPAVTDHVYAPSPPTALRSLE